MEDVYSMTKSELLGVWFDEGHSFEIKEKVAMELESRFSGEQNITHLYEQWRVEKSLLLSNLAGAWEFIQNFEGSNSAKESVVVYRQYKLLATFARDASYHFAIPGLTSLNYRPEKWNVLVSYGDTLLRKIKSQRGNPAVLLLLIDLLEKLIQDEKIAYEKINIESWLVKQLKEQIEGKVSRHIRNYFPEKPAKILSYTPEEDLFWLGNSDELILTKYDRSLDDLTSEDFEDDLYYLDEFKGFYKGIVSKHDGDDFDERKLKLDWTLLIELAHEKKFDHQEYTDKLTAKIDAKNKPKVSEGDDELEMWENIFDISDDSILAEIAEWEKRKVELGYSSTTKTSSEEPISNVLDQIFVEKEKLSQESSSKPKKTGRTKKITLTRRK